VRQKLCTRAANWATLASGSILALERMKEVPARLIAPQELAVLERALRVGAIEPLSDSVFAELPALQVIGVCPCGCRSLYFSGESRGDRRIADTWGRTAEGAQIDIMVWARDGHVAALDLVDYLSTGQLPTLQSIGQPAT
jgi:hypothetical protein